MSVQPLKLVQFPTTEDIPNYSPFCVKAEVLLKMSGLPYEIEWTDDPRKTPNGKLPMLRDGDKIIADSECIKLYLTEEKGVRFDEHLSPREQAQAHAFATMIEERSYWTLVYDRWVVEKNWPVTSNHWFGKMPFPLRVIIPKIARKGVRANLVGHGIGRHSAAHIFKVAKMDLDAIAAQLGDQDFLFGDKPSSVDATVFGFLVNLTNGQMTAELMETIKSYSALIAYVERGLKRWFPEEITAEK